MPIDPLRLRYNSADQRIVNQFSANQLDINRTLERLSTGLRVNSASDSPIDRTRALNVESNIISNIQASENTQDGILVLRVAEDSAKNILEDLQRIRELTLESLNETLTTSDRQNVQNEVNLLVENIFKLATESQYNTRSLLDGSSSFATAFEPASTRLLLNKTLTDSSTGNSNPFIAQIVNTDPDIDVDAVIQFRLFETTSSTGAFQAGLEVTSSRLGLITTTDNFLAFPDTYQIPIDQLTGGRTVTVDISRLGLTTPGSLSLAEVQTTPIQELVDNHRINTVSYGALNLTLGGVNYNNVINVQGTNTIQDVLDAINALTPTNGSISASFNPGTSRVSVQFTGQETLTETTLSTYAPAVPAQAGGPAATFATLGGAPEGPAYRDPAPFLPVAPFTEGSPPPGTFFPSTPVSLSSALDFSGTDASLLSAFGLTNVADNNQVTAYSLGGYFGETLATGNQSEFINRTRVVVQDVSSSQTLNGSDTGLTAADASLTFEALNTAKVDVSAFGAGDFSIDFGSNGVLNFAGFDPDVHSIQDVVNAIDGFSPNVSASFDDTANILSITNTPQEPQVNNPGLSAGTVNIDFGSNGALNFAFDPNTQTIQDVVNAIDGFSPNVSASFDATTDTLSITNTPQEPQVNDPGFVAGDFTIDFGDNGVFDSATALGGFDPNTQTIQDVVNAIDSFSPNVSASFDETTDTLSISNTVGAGIAPNNQIVFGGANGTSLKNFFKVTDTGSNATLLGGTQNSNSSGDIDNSALSPSLDITLADTTGKTLNQLLAPSGGNNQIVFGSDAVSNALRQFFDLADAIDTTTGAPQNITSGADIDNSSASASLDISPADVSGTTFAQLTAPSGGNNQIVFGGANGANIQSFFQLGNQADTGTGASQGVSSASDISSQSIDPSLDISPADVSGLTLTELLTPKLTTLVSGNFQINGDNVLSINPSTTSVQDVVNAINALAGSNGQSYVSNFDLGASGGLQIEITDTETLSPAVGSALLNPGGANPTVNGNELVLDTTAYIADNAPLSYNAGTPLGSGSGPAEQLTFAATTLSPEYTVNAPDPSTADVSGISFSGSNIAGVLFLQTAASGNSTAVAPVAGTDLYRGEIQATGQHAYSLEAQYRRTFEAVSSTTSTQTLGYESPISDGSELGVVAQLYVSPKTDALVADKGLSLQVGAQEGDIQRLGFGGLTPDALSIEGLNLIGSDSNQTRLRGLETLERVDDAIEQTLLALSNIGAVSGSLERRVSQLSQEKSVLNQSLSSIQDADISQEISQLTRSQVVQQAASFALSQNRQIQLDIYDVLFENRGLLEDR